MLSRAGEVCLALLCLRGLVGEDRIDNHLEKVMISYMEVHISYDLDAMEGIIPFCERQG